MLRSLHMKDVGPAARFDLELGERLNVLTGDNGLGKSFVLDVAWWALTGTWVGRPVLPNKGKEESATLTGESLDLEGRSQKFASSFLRARQDWDSTLAAHNRQGVRPMLHELGFDIPVWLTVQSPVLLCRADGDFAVWDPARNYHVVTRSRDHAVAEARPYHFSQADLWDGLAHEGKPLTNGLIRDWERWWLEAAAGKQYPFDLLKKVLRDLSHPDEEMRPAQPRRLYLDDPRDYPTVDLPYGNVPLAHLSAGMRRVVSLAYLIVWAWIEHERACDLLGWKAAGSIVFLIDEVEAHLHPKWQRHIMPRLLDVLSALGSGVKPQILATTHSPMVMTSLEPHFDEEKDKLFLFELGRGEVSLRELPWAKHGDAVAWLTSDVFGLEQARSPEAEEAMEAAYALIEGNTAVLKDGLRTEDEIELALQRVLADQDPFWVDWKVWREHRIR